MRFLAATIAALMTLGALTTPASAADTTLAELAEVAGLTLGVSVDTDTLADEGAAALVLDNATMLTTAFSFAAVQPEPGRFDFAAAEQVVDFAAEHGLTVRGAALVMPDALPSWITDQNWDAASLSEVLRAHVRTVVAHFRERNPGVIMQWEVAGRAFTSDGSLRPSIWQQVIGIDYVRVAIEAAHDADPDAALFYDDVFDDAAIVQNAVANDLPIAPGANAERSTCDAVPKCAAVRGMVQSLVDNDVPLSGVGFSGHLLSPEPMDFSTFSRWVDQFGLQWAIVGFDVPVPATEVAAPEVQSFQALIYDASIRACLAAPACTTFSLAGITDRASSIGDETGGAFDGALPYDTADQPKPARSAMAAALVAAAPPTTPSTVPDSAAASEPAATTAPARPTDPSGGSSVVPLATVGVVALAVVAAVITVARRARR